MNCFILTLFGDPIPWLDKYIENCNNVKGYDWLIFTDKVDYDVMVKKNVTILRMTIDEYSDLFERKLGRKPGYLTTEKFWDMRPAFGIIFEDYLHDYSFWGTTDHDCVYGNLNKFIDLNCDIWTNDPYPTICGHLTLWKNTEKVNNLFKEYSLWEDMLFGETNHILTRPLSGSLSPMSWTTSKLYDEGKIKINYDFDCQENDKKPHKITYKEGLFSDGREIVVYHFRQTKRYPW